MMYIVHAVERKSSYITVSIIITICYCCCCCCCDDGEGAVMATASVVEGSDDPAVALLKFCATIQTCFISGLKSGLGLIQLSIKSLNYKIFITS